MSTIPDYTLVVGVDAGHLRQLAMTWPTWRRHKPDLLRRPMIVFRDRDQVSDHDVRQIVGHPDLRVYAWPMGLAEYEGTPGDKWSDPQRRKMLSGFVHIPALFVRTPYWLKLDTDTVATGRPDWIDPAWFDDQPGIVAHRWGFTKPADQMLQLDTWAKGIRAFDAKAPLNLRPASGSDRVGHARIISWCGFFETATTTLAAEYANNTVGRFQIPVPSQDGYMWYVATRAGFLVRRVDMKARGWQHWLTERNIRKACEESLACGSS